MILLGSSLPMGVAYVETKNLDGETNMKSKKPSKEYVELSRDDEAVQKNFDNVTIECDCPNEFIYKFEG